MKHLVFRYKNINLLQFSLIMLDTITTDVIIGGPQLFEPQILSYPNCII